MEKRIEPVYILLVDDDVDAIEQYKKTLVLKSINNYSLTWDFCSRFDEGRKLINLKRYDVVVADIYVNSEKKNGKKTDLSEYESNKELFGNKFFPRVWITDSQFPEDFKNSPFQKTVDKAQGDDKIIDAIEDLLNTRIVTITRMIHDEIDSYGSKYLWAFLEENWEKIESSGLLESDRLNYLIRRRISTLFSCFDFSGEKQIEELYGFEYYIYPPIQDTKYKLGDIIKNKSNGELQLIITPHCYLEIQPNASKPRADYVMTVTCIEAKSLIKGVFDGGQEAPWSGKKTKDENKLRMRIQCPAYKLGKLEGRYCFLPSFLDIPNMYCDLMQVQSYSYDIMKSDFEKIATLDTPFAESIQNCFTKLYLNVGLPNLKVENFRNLIESE